MFIPIVLAVFFCQLILQGFLVIPHTGNLVGLLALLLAGVHTLFAMLIPIAANVSPPYTMSKSFLTAGIVMFFSAILWTFLASAAVIGIIDLVPNALAAGSFNEVLWQSAVFGTLLSSVFASALSRATDSSTK